MDFSHRRFRDEGGGFLGVGGLVMEGGGRGVYFFRSLDTPFVLSFVSRPRLALTRDESVGAYIYTHTYIHIYIITRRSQPPTDQTPGHECRSVLHGRASLPIVQTGRGIFQW